MIISTSELEPHRGKVAMVDGGFDPIHAGHIGYFREASNLGVPLLLNLSSDEYVARKHRVLLPQRERATILDAIRYIDIVHLSQTSTEEVLGLLAPRYYVKGVDWEGRLPEGELEVCRREGVEVVYLDTVTDSSTEILKRYDS